MIKNLIYNAKAVAGMPPKNLLRHYGSSIEKVLFVQPFVCARAYIDCAGL